MGTVPRLIHCSHVPYDLLVSDEHPHYLINTRQEDINEKRTDAIRDLSSGIPIITLRLHARIANMARVLEHRTIVPFGRSWIRWMSSSRSEWIQLSDHA